MAAGTISLTNGSTTVNGTGTSFATELKAGDFIYVTVGGAPYTLVASSVTSNSQLSLAVAFDGPSSTGVAWNAVPASLQVAITQKILNDFASVARGRILDFQNWQKIYSSEESVTVTRPDRTTFAGPSWGYMAGQFVNKLDKAGGTMTGGLTVPSIELLSAAPYVDFHYNNSSADYNVRITNDADRKLTIVGQDGASCLVNVIGTMQASQIAANGAGINTRVASPATTPATGTETSSGIFEAGYSSGVYAQVRTLFHTTVVQGSGSSGIIAVQTSAGGAYTRYQFNQSGSAYAPGSWVSLSDMRLKKNIQRIEDPLEKMRVIKGVTWERLDGIAPGIGFIAQDVQKVFPNSVTSVGNRSLEDGTLIEGVLSPDTSGVAAALHHEAILSLMDIIDELKSYNSEQDEIIKAMGGRLKDLDGLDG